MVLTDAVLLAGAWFAAFWLRFNFSIPSDVYPVLINALPLVLSIEMVAFYWFDLYRGMWRYTSLEDLYNTLKADTAATLLLLVGVGATQGLEGFSRSVFVINWVLVMLAAAGCRVGIRVYFAFKDERRKPIASLKNLFAPNGQSPATGKKLLIIGAGDSGEKIYREIRDNPRLRYRVVGFIDDDPTKLGRKIHGIPIMGTTDEITDLARQADAQELLIAIPSASSQKMRAIVDKCKQSGLSFKTLPGMGELIDGKVTIKAIRDVAYRDLLGREVVCLDEALIGAYLKNTTVLVTGAGGSIGSELCRQICRFKPETLVLFERAESSLYAIDLELRKNFPFIRIVPLLGDIRDRKQLTMAFETHRPSTVFHAAAYKHVPMIEIHPWEGVRNNIFGTRNVVEIARDHKVERFVLVSTDKAVRPTNVMGASKRVAELMVQGQNACGRADTRFITVRFGNVVGSVGSVIPLFKQQIAEGGPVTVTHPEMTRYFMTIPEASQLILQAAAMGEGGEIFILDMGEPVKILDMARDLIRLSGFEPESDIPIQFIGLRPGEKLYEELITEGEGIVPTSHEKILVLRGAACDLAHLDNQIQQLNDLAGAQDGQAIKAMLGRILPEYTPDKRRSVDA